MSHTICLTVNDGTERELGVRHAFNAGYSGRDTGEVQRHVAELAALGVPAPGQIPTLYPLPARLVTQETTIEVPHAKTSGEAEWALIVGEDVEDLLLTVASDHTDRALEVHGVAWSKQTAPNLVGEFAWRLQDIHADLDDLTLRAWVTHADAESLIQDGTLAQLLPPAYWVERLQEHSLLRPGTVLLGGTLSMMPGVEQFADSWRVEIADQNGQTSQLSYQVLQLSPAWD